MTGLNDLDISQKNGLCRWLRWWFTPSESKSPPAGVRLNRDNRRDPTTAGRKSALAEKILLVREEIVAITGRKRVTVVARMRRRPVGAAALRKLVGVLKLCDPVSNFVSAKFAHGLLRNGSLLLPS